jgi:two-component system nitrogen regulation sensor histidine kinase NtrY
LTLLSYWALVKALFIGVWKNMTLKVSTQHSIEHQLKKMGITLLLMFLGGLLWVLYLLEVSSLVIVTCLTLLLPLFIIWLWRFYHKIVAPFYSLTNLVESIRLEDYSLRTKDQYHTGIVHSLHKEVKTLADDLQQRKQVYDQHTLLIYHLIEQLDAPIAIFNQKHQLSHANSAFTKYIGQPWQFKRLSNSASLGLSINKNSRWSFVDEKESSRWQLKQSQFIQDEKTYHLVVLTNIEKVLRENQQNSWQQIIRVLSHEIRNSLTPIKSLAQTLVELPTQQDSAKKALQVIVERSTSLQEFVNRYGDIAQRFTVEKRQIQSRPFTDMLVALFPDQLINSEINSDTIYADPTLLKQVMINLLKNAVEAYVDGEKRCISLVVSLLTNSKGEQELIIEVIDSGQGIANVDNLFVPFYTTKGNGHGIGLSLCQNIIEQHDGRLTLTNNKTEGASAKIFLPMKSPH